MEIREGSVIFPLPDNTLLSEKEKNGGLNYQMRIKNLLRKIMGQYLLRMSLYAIITVMLLTDSYVY
ncbi:hypothetical protein [Sporolactobacillus sp. CQH2019]|uniref:hypothetical protein n=1 Tax=Sporolactobacillus sp. CQH2019 TaxID=3023512 RepID=UPI003FD14C86